MAFGATLRRLIRSELAFASLRPETLEGDAEANQQVALQKHEAVLARLKTAKETPQNLLVIGTIHREMGDLESAIKSWRRGVKIAPRIDELRFNLLCGLFEAGETKHKEYESLLSSLTVKPQSYYLYGSNPDGRRLSAYLKRYGTALVKGFYDPKVAAERDRVMRENMERGKPVLSKHIAIGGTTLPAWFACSHACDDTFEQRLDQAYEEKLFTLNKYSTPTEMEDLSDFTRKLMDDGLRTAVSDYLGYDNHSLQHERSMSRMLTALGSYYLGSHQDVRHSRDYAHFVNFWIPFTHCGKYSPTLGFIPMRFFNYFPTDGLTAVDIRRDAVPPGIYHTPDFEPGDLLIMTSFTMHASINKPDMTETRTSVDLRIM